MTIVKEVVDGIKLVADGIDNIRKIHDAIRDGTKFIKEHHPEVREDVANMCIEMRKTLQSIATASSIITHFRFNVSDQIVKSEPSRFNEHFIRHKAEVKDVESQLDSLRGHCTKIRQCAEALDEKAKTAKLAGMLKLFGFDSSQREKELSDSLEKIYNEEMAFHSNVWGMRMIMEKSLEDIGDRLGPPGMMDSSNVPDAAKALGEYAEVFSKLESDANYEALRLQRLVNTLIKG